MHYSKLIKPIFVFAFIWLFSFSGSAQYDIPKKPSFIPAVIDSTETLNESEFNYLHDKLVRYNDSTSTEIIIVIIPSTKGENIGLLAPRWGHKWEIGKKNKDNGVFILLAKQDRKVWISPGYGLEHKLTAGIVGEITRNIIIPEFKNGDYFSGLNLGTDAIIDVLAGTFKNTQKAHGNSILPVIIFLVLFIIFIVFIIAISKQKGGGKGGNRGNRSDGTSILESIILSNMGRSSSSSSRGWGGSSSGGSFGGFGGGGGFSGGGAGGSW